MSATEERAREDRYDALDLAVRYHGASNTTPRAIPASVPTVVDTADVFYRYIKSGEHPPPRKQQ